MNASASKKRTRWLRRSRFHSSCASRSPTVLISTPAASAYTSSNFYIRGFVGHYHDWRHAGFRRREQAAETLVPVCRAAMEIDNIVNRDVAKSSKIIAIHVVSKFPRQRVTLALDYIVRYTCVPGRDYLVSLNLLGFKSLSRRSVAGPLGATNIQRRGGVNTFRKAWKIMSPASRQAVGVRSTPS